ncbi:MAG: class II glutamine amidotransferase [Pseudomonadota bacterium]
MSPPLTLLLLAACRPPDPGFHPGVHALEDSSTPTDDSASPDDTADSGHAAPPMRPHGPPFACIRSIWPDYGVPARDPGRDATDSRPEAPSPLPHECRLWAATSAALPPALLQAHLVDLPDAIKALGAANDDGWGLGWWPPGQPTPEIRRGQAPATEDPFFDDAVTQAQADTPTVAVAHVRACSSGLCDLPDPHPFAMDLLGRRWLLGHNGTIEKSLLLALIDPDFLADHPPQNGTNEAEWIDSELYLRLLLQQIQAEGGQVEEAIREVVWRLHAGPGRVSGANFFLSDGATLWAYRDGNTLSYFYDDYVAPCAAVASDFPTESRGRWIKLEDGQLVVLHPDRAPDLLQIWWKQDEGDGTAPD